MKEKYHTHKQSFLELFSHFSKEEVDFVRSNLNIQEFAKKDFLFQRGAVQKEIAFVCKGLLRRYYINEKGNTITTGFTKEHEYATDYPSFIRQQPSKYYFEFLEPSIVIKLKYDTLQKGYTKYKNSERYGRLIAEEVLSIQTDRVESFLFQNAEERYLDFIKHNKDLINRISLTHLASYLGIERQSLSRIRGKIAKN